MKRLGKFVLIASIVLLLLYLGGQFAIGCLISPSNDFEITSVDEAIKRSHKGSRKYSTFWHALENMDLESAESLASNPEHTQVLDGLNSVLHADIGSAITTFQILYRTSTDSLVVHTSKAILAELLMLDSRWEEFTQLLDSDPSIIRDTKIDNSDRIFAQSLTTVPREVYHFPDHSFTVPTEINRVGLPMIEVRINGYREKFLLDTGASVSVVTSSLADKCAIEPIGDAVGVGETSTSKKIEFRPAIIEELKIGDLTIEHRPVVIVKDADLEFELFGLPILKVDGIIGWPLFKETVIEIDYKNKLTTISMSVNQSNTDRNLFWLGYPIVTLRSPEGISLNFGVDTGSQSTSIKRNIFSKINVGRIEDAGGVAVGTGGSERVSKQRAYDVTFYLDDYRLDFDSISTTHGVKGTVLLKPDGKLGSDIAQDGKFIIDYLNGRFELKLED